MRIVLPSLPKRLGGSAGLRCRAFTMTEVMIASALMTMLVLGIISANIFGARLYEITRLKLGASNEARAAISKMVDEIRSAKIIYVGNVTLSTFTQDINGIQQRGSALQIYATTNTNTFVRYFWDQGDGRLKRTTNGASAFSIVANSVSNQMVFTVEDATGSIVTNNQNNRVIGIGLQFYQLAYPIVNIPGPLFEYYQIRTKVTRRVLE